MESHGSEYYRQLLERSADENLKPKRSTASLTKIRYARGNWEKFCQQILGPNVDPVERLRTIRLRDIQVYMRWVLATSKMIRLSSIMPRMKIWSMMYRDVVGPPLNNDLRFQMTTDYQTTLKEDFNLDPTESQKESINVDDLLHLLKHLWIRDTHVYPVERQRVQQALITLLIALTSVRPGAIVESSSYRGSNEALLYKDVALRLVRDPAEANQTMLLMEVTIMLWKGVRERMKPHLSSQKPEFKESTLLRWKESWLNRPIFRRACSIQSGTVTSTTKALHYESFASQTKALGRDAGFRVPLQPYAFRRGAAQAVNKIATTAERNQIMGHSRTNIYEKYYQNRYVNIDISAAVLKMPSRSSLLESVGHIGLDRDPRVPQTLDKEEQDTVLNDPRLIELTVEIKDYRATVPKECICNTREREERTPEWKHLRNLQARRLALRRRLLRQAKAKKQRRFFDTVDNDDIRQGQLGLPITHNQSTPVYALPSRANLADIFNQVDPEDRRSSQSSRRSEALQSLIDLCQMREPHHKNPASKVKWLSYDPVLREWNPKPEDTHIGHSILTMEEAFATMELVPLELPSTVCLFCLGDANLASHGRSASFSRIDSMRRHVEDVHLIHYEPDLPLLCPHPSCDTSLRNIDHFKNHAATVHNVILK